MREREDEDDDGTDDARGQRRRTDGDEGVEIDWSRTTGERGTEVGDESKRDGIGSD